MPIGRCTELSSATWSVFETGGERAHRGPGETPLPALPPAPSTVRTVLIHSGWEKLDKPSGGFFKGGKGPKARDQLWLRPRPPGVRRGRDSPSVPARPESLSRIPAGRGGPPVPRFSPPHRGEGRLPGSREADPGPGRARDRALFPAALPARGLFLHTGWWKWGPIPGTFPCTQGRGKEARDLPRLGKDRFWPLNEPPGAGFSALARPLTEPPFRAADHRVGLAETFPTSPGPGLCDLPSPRQSPFPGRSTSSRPVPTYGMVGVGAYPRYLPLHAGKREGSQGPPLALGTLTFFPSAPGTLWDLEKFRANVADPRYLPLHAGKRGESQGPPGLREL